jgi:hypothetical protein
MDFRTAVAELLTIGGNARFNLYQYASDPADSRVGRRVDKFLLNEEGRLWDLTGFTISIGTRLSGEKIQSKSGPELTPGDSLGLTKKKSYVSLYDEEPADFSIPWNLDLSWNYSENRPSPQVMFRSSTLAARLGFNLTQAWKISTSANYDIISRQV